MSKGLSFRKSWLLRIMSLYPPYLGAGIRVKEISPDFTSLRVEMKLRFWNRNYVGTQFGGSLYSMTDPFFMLMLLENLGRDYIVWDKAATIRFKRPGTGRVHAHFKLEPSRIADIRAAADSQDKVEPVFQIAIIDDSGKTVAEVEKTLYVRRKDSALAKKVGALGSSSGPSSS